ncbi:transposase [Streptosporangium sp. NPDC049376]|uniref:transposase n=1 Tax=Streptosporangium sp. NPDC049376 TaxID=3366192 RepID=UPI0037B5A5EC
MGRLGFSGHVGLCGLWTRVVLSEYRGAQRFPDSPDRKPGRGKHVTRRRRQFSPEFGEEAVRMVLDGPRSVAAVAREFGMNRHWINTRKSHLSGNPQVPHQRTEPFERTTRPQAAAPAERTTPPSPVENAPERTAPMGATPVLTERSGPRERSSPQELPSWGKGCS